ncbi:MAG: PH domain-containing protein [Oscillospiraceae bacterium]|nr:PH domain-containing protein [Oscillospiraceae bacterium]
MRKYQPKHAALIVIDVAIVLLTIILTCFTVGYLSNHKIIMTLLLCLFWLAAILFAAILLPGYFSRTVIYISPSEISMKTGIIYVKRHQMKTSAIQYVSTITAFMSKYTGLNFVILRAMGGTMVLPFLGVEDLREIEELMRNS